MSTSLLTLGKKEISVHKMLKLDKYLFDGCSPFSVFRGIVAYFDCYQQVTDSPTEAETSLKLLDYDFKFHSGKVSTTITKDTTHIVLHSSELDHLEELIEKAGQIKSNAHIVQHYWLVECIKAKNRLPEDNYCLHHLSYSQQT